MSKKVLVINGPNLNMTGIREPQVYGSETLDMINYEIKEYAENLGIECDFFQSNGEGEIIDAIHSVLSDYDGCIINAGAYTHYSFAIADAVRCVKKSLLLRCTFRILPRARSSGIFPFSRPFAQALLQALGKKAIFLRLRR